MALSTPSYISETTSTSASTSVTTASFTPTANALVLISIGLGTFTSDPGTISVSSDTFGAGMGAWTSIGQANVSGSNPWRVAVFWAIAGASPGSGTVTLGWSVNSARQSLHVWEVASGYDSTTPIVLASVGTNTFTGASGSGTLDVTLGSTPAATSLACGTIVSSGDGAGITPGTGFTELRETDSGGSPSGTLQTEYDATPVDTSVDWSDLALEGAGVAFEIQEAAASGGGMQLVGGAGLVGSNG